MRATLVEFARDPEQLVVTATVQLNPSRFAGCSAPALSSSTWSPPSVGTAARSGGGW